MITLIALKVMYAFCLNSIMSSLNSGYTNANYVKRNVAHIYVVQKKEGLYSFA